MALTASGAISLNDVNVELGFASTATIAMNDAAVRTLFGIASGAIAMSDGYGKANTLGFIEDVFSCFSYTGNSTNRSIVNDINLSGKGGLVWIKDRNLGLNHTLFDTARGATNYLFSDNTNAQDSAGNTLTAFNSNGFNLGTNSSYVNGSGYTYVSWTFREQPKFFDIVTYTGDGTSSRVIPHNLGSAPGCIIIKRTDLASSWFVFHRSAAQNLLLNSTTDGVGGLFYIASSASTTFTLGTNTSSNASAGTYVAYLFAHDAGGYGATGTDNIISCGSFTTDGSGNATVSLGYEPQWVLVKRTSNVGDWLLQDNMRGMSQTNLLMLNPNTSNAEYDYGGPRVVPTATGFNIVNNYVGASQTAIYIAIRRGLMKPVNTSVYNAVTRTASGPPQLISGIGFAPDLAIIKARTISIDPHWFNRFRGNNRALRSNSVDAEYNANFTLTGATGTVTAGGNDTALSGRGYVDWFFRRATGFFDLVTYTGDGSYSRNITHGLGVTPELIILKSTNGYVQDWFVNATPFTNFTNGYPCAFLNTTNTITGNSNTGVKNPTSTTFEVNHPNTNTSNPSFNEYIAFLFATYPGISKVGSYSGTGALQTVNCGFTSGARFILIKRIDSTGGWYVWDSVRGITSGSDPYLLLNSVNEEVGGTNYVDTDSTGFKVTAAAPADLNASGGSYFFFAIA